MDCGILHCDMTNLFASVECITIDLLMQCTRASATKVGETCYRYAVIINGNETYLFEDEDRLFVEAKGNVRC